MALHLHSVDSHDWGRGSADKDRNSPSRFEGESGLRAFADELRPQLDLVAVTDHMRCSFATRLSKSLEGDKDLTILPGMEVNLVPEAALGVARIHVLVIFPEGTSPETCAKIFHGQNHIPDDAERSGNEEVVGISLEQFVNRVHEEGGVCIAAHVDGNQGVRRLFRQTAKEVLSLFSEGEPDNAIEVGDAIKAYLHKTDLDAVEIHSSSDAKHYVWENTVDGKRRFIPTTMQFDAHCCEHFSRTERLTYLKMTRMDIAGLKDALRFPDTRIRFHDNLPSPPSPMILGIELVGEEGSFFKDLTIALAENLNCLIGARGSGKSTVVEALRYVLGYNRTLSDLGKLEEPIRELQRANLKGCLVRSC